VFLLADEDEVIRAAKISAAGLTLVSCWTLDAGRWTAT